MRIQIVSDLHFEFGTELNKELIDPIGDVLVIAGDTHVGKRLTVKTLMNISEFIIKIPIIVVLGNHEFYGSEYESFRKSFDRQRVILKKRNIYLLDRRTIIIDNIKFIGATGWTDGSYMKYERYHKYKMTDMRTIGGFKNNYGGQIWGKEDCAYIINELKNNSNDMNVVIVTHHAPTELSLHEKFRGALLNTFFINDWSNIIDLYNPNLWIHGHNHLSFNYEIYNTKVVCNPFGYNPYEVNPDYKNDLIVEV